MDERKRGFLVIGIVVLIIFGGLLSIYVADTRARRSAYARAESVLLDSAQQQADTFSATLDSRFQTLQSISAALSLSGAWEPAAVETMLDNIIYSADLGFASVDLIYPDGTMASMEDLHGLNVSDRAYFRQAMAGQRALENIVGRQTGRHALTMAIPYYQDDAIGGVLRGTCYERELRSLLNTQAYGGSGYSLLICSHGDIVVNTDGENAYLDSNNILDAFSAATFDQGGSLEQLQEYLAAGEKTTLHYERDGSSRIAVLIPLASESLPVNDWFILNIIYTDSLTGEIEASRRDSIESMEIFAVFAALALLLFLLLERDVRKRRQVEAEKARQREEQFRIVTEQSEKFVMRYDIPSRTATMGDNREDGLDNAAVYPDAAEEVIRRGLVDPTSHESCRAFFRQIEAGESPVSADLLLVKTNGERRWFRHMSTTIFDQDDQPRTAIISYFDNTEQRERELAYAKWQQELESISYDAAALYEWNLTKDVSDGQFGQLINDYSHLPVDNFDGRTAAFSQARVFEEDKPAFVAMMNREHLLALYLSKVYRDNMHYRYISDDGQLRWHDISVQMVPYPDGKDIKVYVTNRDIHEEKQEELAILARSQHDFLTGALNRETLMERVRQLIDRAPASNHALLMMDIDGFKLINDSLGHDAGDQVLREVTERIRADLRSGDIVGRIGGDEFMICLADMPFEAAISKKAGRICQMLRRQLSRDITLSVSIGVAVYPRDGSSFSQLYRRADAALYYAKAHGKDSFAIFRDGMGDNPQLQHDQPAPA